MKQGSHDDGVLSLKLRAAGEQLPPGLDELGEIGTRYHKVFAAGNRPIQRKVQTCTSSGVGGQWRG